MSRLNKRDQNKRLMAIVDGIASIGDLTGAYDSTVVMPRRSLSARKAAAWNRTARAFSRSVGKHVKKHGR